MYSSAIEPTDAAGLDPGSVCVNDATIRLETAWGRLIIWGILQWRWGNRYVALKPVNTLALALLLLSLLLTFPPVVDLL